MFAEIAECMSAEIAERIFERIVADIADCIVAEIAECIVAEVADRIVADIAAGHCYFAAVGCWVHLPVAAAAKNNPDYEYSQIIDKNHNRNFIFINFTIKDIMMLIKIVKYIKFYAFYIGQS